MAFFGKVGRGRGFGRTIGFPTVNIPLTDASVSGIYAARVKVGEEEFPAAAYADQDRNVLEAHILDWSGDLYGKDIEITLAEKIREAVTFSDMDSLTAAIHEDVAKIRKSLDN